jgi:hypothetical protein
VYDLPFPVSQWFYFGLGAAAVVVFKRLRAARSPRDVATTEQVDA